MGLMVALLGLFACFVGYVILVNRLVVRSQPLKGSWRNFFFITAGPIFFFFLIANIALSFKLFPDIMQGLANGSGYSLRGRASLAALFVTPLPVFALLLWHRILVAIQPQVENTYAPPPPDADGLSSDKIESPRSASGISTAVIFRKKELRPPPGYFFVVLNGTVVAALKGGEYTRLSLERPQNEIGCYAMAQQGMLKSGYRYKYTSQVFDVHKEGWLSLMLGSDVFQGSCLDRVKLKKAKNYQEKFTYVAAGPRPTIP
jgi:hypothetical protein